MEIENFIEQLGFNISKDRDKKTKKTHYKLSGNLESVRKLLENRHKTLKINNDAFTKDLERNDNEFCGGSFAKLKNDLEGKTDLTNFIKVKQNLLSKGFFSNIQEKLETLAPKRKRCLSETDGDYDHARKWDIAPYIGFTYAPSLTRTIEIDCDLCLPYSVSSDRIDAYAALCWAVSDIVESYGIQTRLVVSTESENFCESRNNELKTTICVKDFGEYVSQQSVAAAFQCNFLRRAIFASWNLAAEYAGSVMAASRGRVIAKDRAIRSQIGRIELSPDVREGMTKELLEAILEAIGCV